MGRGSGGRADSGGGNYTKIVRFFALLHQTSAAGAQAQPGHPKSPAETSLGRPHGALCGIILFSPTKSLFLWDAQRPLPALYRKTVSRKRSSPKMRFIENGCPANPAFRVERHVERVERHFRPSRWCCPEIPHLVPLFHLESLLPFPVLRGHTLFFRLLLLAFIAPPTSFRLSLNRPANTQ